MRGHIPSELDRGSVDELLGGSLLPYRVIYEVIGQDVFVHCVLDGRRDMQSLLLSGAWFR